MRVAINGLGRIGRALVRALSQDTSGTFELVAVNGPASRDQHIHLLTYDSVHGTFPGTITAEGDKHLNINGKSCLLLQERDITKLDWAALGVDLVFECTGRFNQRDQAAAHLQNGAKKVLVSAPCTDADATIVYGVNHAILNASHQVISVGSCTTNCLAPVAQAMHETIGIEQGFMTTIHAYTNDQNLVDGSHKDMRRARAAAMSMIPTSTGAAKAIGLVIPALAGKLAGAAVRVPTPNVSMIDFCFTANRATSKEEVNQILTDYAKGPMQGVLATSTLPLVSIDFNHHPASSIADLAETHVVNGRFCRIVAWYDNEWAFTLRMLDVARCVG